MSLKFVPDSKHVSLVAQLVKNLPAHNLYGNTKNLE